MADELWTVGHSTHPLERFVELLEAHRIELLADVRTVPKSRRHPHFRADQLEVSLPRAGIAYRHMPALGGFRKPTPGSPNGAWTNDSFRGYADYALTEAFAAGLGELTGLAAEQRVAIMCSEALWWRCHRRLIADRLVAAGRRVHHIGADGRVAEHELADFAQLQADGTLVYPPSTQQLELPG
jgi:uncharacterized protein (DUF488 family)